MFIHSSKGADAYTLSVYNKASKYRPQTAPTQNWLSGYEKLPAVPEEDAITTDNRLPEFKTPNGLGLIARTGNDGYRL